MMTIERQPPRRALSDDAGAFELTYHRLLGARLYLHTWVRLIVVCSIIVGAIVARYVVGIHGLNVTALIMLAVVIAGYNAIAWFVSRSYRAPERAAGSYQLVLHVMYGTIVMDYLSLTVAIWIVGGARSPFLVFYLLHVILSCILLSRRAAMCSITLAYLLLASLVITEWTRWVPVNVPVGAIAGSEPIDGRFALTLLVVYGMLFGLVGFLLVGLSALLRRGERDLKDANVELDRLSNMRRDFLHIALHDLKSPVGAISGLLGNLRDGLCGELNDRQQEWIRRSLQRVAGLESFLADLQTLASLETDGLLEEQMQVIDVAELLRDLVQENQDLARARRDILELQVPDDLRTIRGVPRLLRAAIANYITNAIKYTPEGGCITIRGRNIGDVVRIEVQDNGIGIAPEHQARLFDEFVRLRRPSSVRDAPGSGLGLSIVRRIVHRHDGRVKVESELNRGSTFIIELPASSISPAS